jgi:D-methionine transport system substrate-binding protein
MHSNAWKSIIENRSEEIKMRKYVFTLLSLFTVAGLITGCGNTPTDALKVGIPNSDTQVWEYIQQKAAKEGLPIELVQFNDYVQPNLSLADGSIDANAFQTIAYFNNFTRERHLELTAIGTTFLAPMGIYSKKYTDIQQIPAGSTLTIPNDPTNGGRALLLLQKAGIIQLTEGFNGKGSIEAIVANPKNLKITPIAAPQTPRSLDDAAAAAINNDIAVNAGYNPMTDPILREDETALPYLNIIAVQTKNKDNPQLKKLVEIYQTEDVKKVIEKVYQGAQIPTFLPVSEIVNL